MVLYAWEPLQQAHSDIWSSIEETRDLHGSLTRLITGSINEDLQGGSGGGMQGAWEMLSGALEKVFPALEELHTTMANLMGHAAEADEHGKKAFNNVSV